LIVDKISFSKSYSLYLADLNFSDVIIS